jgi:hypothetical protein
MHILLGGHQGFQCPPFCSARGSPASTQMHVEQLFGLHYAILIAVL